MADEDWQTILPGLLAAAGIDSAVTGIAPLTGGVSSDIVRVSLADGRSLCAKRALPQLKVAALWEAPLERNHYEAAWLRRVKAIRPTLVPAVLAEDEAHGTVLLDYLPPDDFMLWKAELLAGRFPDGAAERVAEALAAVHEATWGDAAMAGAFATDDLFEALRVSPYLVALAERVPDLSRPILAVAEATRSTHLALVHGDVSPKNILLSRNDGHPVLLDAECAWYGDPAFDAGFCLNHLVLKAVHLPALRGQLLDAAERFASIWGVGLPEDGRDAALGRVGALLPCLMLARIDGKSPVEYLSETERESVRALARPLIAQPPSSAAEALAGVRAGIEGGIAP